MKPILLFRHRGFLIRVVNNGSRSHPYEWTLDGITPSIKSYIRKENLESKRYHKKIASMRFEKRRIHTRITPISRLNNVLKRLYDPTSMPTARKTYGALGYAKDEVDSILATFSNKKPYVIYTFPVKRI